MIRAVAIAAALLIAAPVFAADLPDPDLTPGATRDGVTAADLCPVAHTAKVRNVTAALKRQVYERYGLAGNHTGYCAAGPEGCEVDHLVSLELGGANDIENLWPQSYDGSPWNAHVKDRLENTLHKLVCAGTITLDEAQTEIRGDWTAAYRKYLGEP
jgi:hypothetical protein